MIGENVKKFLNTYIKIWRSIFDYDHLLSRSHFWVFISVNFICLLVINEICDFFRWYNLLPLFYLLFIVLTIIGGMQRMEDIKRPRYYIFLPFYNLFLLLQKGVIQEEEAKTNTSGFNFIKLFFYSLIMGLLNLILCVVFTANCPVNLGSFFLMVVYSSFLMLIFWTFYIVLVNHFKQNITNKSLFIYFLRFILFSCIISFFFISEYYC